jgi:hypothetical protein
MFLWITKCATLGGDLRESLEKKVRGASRIIFAKIQPELKRKQRPNPLLRSCGDT